jgi:hypothetical protein
LTQRSKIFIWITVGAVCSVLLLLGTAHFMGIHFAKDKDPIVQTVTSNVISYADLVNLRNEEIQQIKDREIVRMLRDTALAYNLRPYPLCGLAFHESERLRKANEKWMDRNNRYSYGVFSLQLETVQSEVDKDATEDRLLTPAFNMHYAMMLFTKNLAKYHGSYELAIAAHNAGSVKNNHITNMDFVKKVYASTGEFAARYDLAKLQPTNKEGNGQ